MNKITLIIKPSNACNLNCVYCYDHPHRIYSHELMAIDTIANIMKKVTKYYNNITIIWHGGEPLLIDINNFYIPIYENIISKYINLGIKVTSLMQSNGTHLNDDIVKFVKKYNIKLGLSHDGLYNDDTRRSTQLYNKCKELGELNNLDFWNRALTVLTPNSDIDIVENYKQSKQKFGVTLTFNELFQKNLTIEDYDFFIDSYMRLFKYIVFNTDDDIQRTFIPFINKSLNLKGNLICNNSNCVGYWLGFSFNGTIYPCGRYWDDDFSYGNINQIDDLSEIYNSDSYKKLRKSEIILDNKCKNCELLEVCHNGCPNTRLINFDDVSKKDSFQCHMNKELYHRINDIIQNIKTNKYQYVNPNLKKLIDKGEKLEKN